MIKVKYIGDQPHRQTRGSSGYDLKAMKGMSIAPGSASLIPVDLMMEIPIGYEAQVRPRSGLALKKGLTVLNTPGTIDADYRGQVGVILINHSDKMHEVLAGDRIAQLVFCKVEEVDWEKTEELEESDRGEGGFGSTGEGEDWEKADSHLAEIIAENQQRGESFNYSYLKQFVYPKKRKMDSGVRTSSLYKEIMDLPLTPGGKYLS